MKEKIIEILKSHSYHHTEGVGVKSQFKYLAEIAFECCADEIMLALDQSQFTADEAEELINQEVEKRIAERMEGKIKTGVSYYFVERLSDRAWLTGAFGWTHEPTEAWMTTEKDAMENIVTGMFYGRCVVTEHIFDPEPALRSRLVSQKTEGGGE